MIWKVFAAIGMLSVALAMLALLRAFIHKTVERRRKSRMKFYVTFGQRYRREEHPVLGLMPTLPDGYLTIEAATHEQARSMVELTLGEAWSDIYPLRPDPLRDQLFPLGVLGEITMEIIRKDMR